MRSRFDIMHVNFNVQTDSNRVFIREKSISGRMIISSSTELFFFEFVNDIPIKNMLQNPGEQFL